MSSGA